MLNISQLRLQLAEDGVQATSIARAELTTRVAEYKELGDEARAIVFGSHRKAQAVIVPIDLLNQLLDMAEGIVTTPKVAPVKQRVRAAKNTDAAIGQAAADAPPAPAEPKQVAGTSLRVGANTQELIDQIMNKWNLQR